MDMVVWRSSNITDEDQSSGDTATFRAAEIIWIYISPIIIIVGTIGSALSIAVLTRASMRTSATMFYLCCLSVTDLFVLYLGLTRHFVRHAIHTDLRNSCEFLCKFHPFAVYFTIDMSAWILVAVSVDRCITVLLPFYTRANSSINKSRLIIILIALILALINCHFFFTLTLTDSECGPVDKFEAFIDVTWQWIDIAVYSAIPFAIMIVCSVLIVKQIVRTRNRIASSDNGIHNQLDDRNRATEKKEDINDDDVFLDGSESATKNNHAVRKYPIVHFGVRPLFEARDNTDTPSSVAGRGMGRTRTHNSSGDSKVNKIIGIKKKHKFISSLSLMLLTMNMVFLLLTMPIAIYFIIWYGWPDVKISATQNELIVAVLSSLMYSNNAAHFFLYSLTSPKFRQKLKSILAIPQCDKHKIAPEKSLAIDANFAKF